MENKIDRSIEIDKQIIEIGEFIHLSESGSSVSLMGRTFSEGLNEYIAFCLKNKLAELHIESINLRINQQ